MLNPSQISTSEIRHRGLEPRTHGLRDCCLKNVKTCDKDTCENGEKISAIYSAINDQDLAALVEAWEFIPLEVKQAIITMAKTTQKK